jgi:hypothetical protein
MPLLATSRQQERSTSPVPRLASQTLCPPGDGSSNSSSTPAITTPGFTGTGEPTVRGVGEAVGVAGVALLAVEGEGTALAAPVACPVAEPATDGLAAGPLADGEATAGPGCSSSPPQLPARRAARRATSRSRYREASGRPLVPGGR